MAQFIFFKDVDTERLINLEEVVHCEVYMSGGKKVLNIHTKGLDSSHRPYIFSVVGIEAERIMNILKSRIVAE